MTRRLMTWLTGAQIALVASPALAGGGFVMNEHGFFIIDALIFFGVIYYFARKPAQAFLVNRHEAVRKEIESATAVKAEAKERYDRYRELLDGLDNEIDTINANVLADGEREKARILEEANDASERLRQDIARQVDLETANVRDALGQEMIERAVALAEQRVRERMSPELQKQLVATFISDLEGRDAANGL
jgi:F-type H+-transporting ATPase subunit b